MIEKDLEKIELDLLLEGIFKRYGYDFRHYAQASLKRRIRKRMLLSEIPTISDMVSRILHDEAFFNVLLGDLSITVTDFFRNPRFYSVIRQKIIPILKTYPFVKIWHAGCATAEEVYSMAIVLHEEGFLDRAQIYATDYNNHSLQVAKEGIYPIKNFKGFTENYNNTQPKGSFADYFTIRYQAGKIEPFLKERITFANHNLVTDGVFGEMNLIICRNVMIYFNQTLQNRVLDLFSRSLCHRGILCLGNRESLGFSEIANSFETINKAQRIFRKTVLSGVSQPPVDLLGDE